MAINASYGHGVVLRNDSIIPPKAIRADFKPTVTNNSNRKIPASRRPQSKKASSQRAIAQRTFDGKTGNVDVVA